MAKVIGFRLRVDEYIVKIDDYPFVEYWIQHFQHHVRECRGRIGETKGDDIELEMAIATTKSRFMSMRLIYALLMVSGDQVELGEVTGTSEPIDELVDTRERMPVFLGDPIETPIVDTHPERTVGFLDKEDWSAIWRGARFDELFGQELV